MIRCSFLKVLSVISIPVFLVSLAIGGAVQPASASAPELLDSADYTFVYPDPSGNNSLPDPTVWTMQTSSGGSDIVQAPIDGVGLGVLDPDNGASLMYVHNTPFLSGDPSDPNFQNTATFRVRVMVPYVSDGSSHWSAEAIGWRMIVDDGGARLEISLARSPSHVRQVRIEHSVSLPSMDFPWDNGLDNIYEIRRLANGDFVVTLTNVDPSNPNPVVSQTIPRGLLPPSLGAPQFAWGTGREGGGAAYWVQAHAETHGSVPNQPPTILSLSAPLDPVPVNTAISASASFDDPDGSDTHTATWNWGDGSTSAGAVSEAGGTGTVSGGRVYADAGVYPVTVTVTDNHGASAQSTFNYVVAYDPNAGFVTGGGWIGSPVGAYAPDPSLSGKASFGFVSKYLRGASVPTGRTEFQFKAGGLNFRSTLYDWLVVGGAMGRFKGSGTINGSGDYGFMVTVVDGQVNGGGGVDKFRIKVWEKASGNMVYDNQMGAADDASPTTAIGGGSIVIHK